MINFTRTVGISAAAALVAVTGLTVTAPQASAASCTGSKCNGKNPDSTGCSKDGKTMAHAYSYGHEIDLRYSKKCKAFWVRGEFYMDVTIKAGHYDHCGSWVTDKSYKTPNRSDWFINDDPYWEWTPMISSSYDYYRMYDNDDHYWRWKNTKKPSSALEAKRPLC